MGCSEAKNLPHSPTCDKEYQYVDINAGKQGGPRRVRRDRERQGETKREIIRSEKVKEKPIYRV